MPFVTSSVLSVLDTPARQLSRIVHTATINIAVPATLSIAPKIRTETGLCSVSKKNTGKPRYKNKNSRNLHGNFHEFHKTNFVLSDLVCLYSLLFLMKHFHKIATIKSDYACYGNQLKFHCPYPLKFQFINLPDNQNN